MANITSKIKQLGISALMVGVIGMSLSACGGDAATATPPPAPTATVAAAAATSGISSSDAQVVNIVLKEWSIEPSNIEVKAGKVKFVVTNQGKYPHDIAFNIDGMGDASKLKPFKTADNPQTLELDLKPGTYNMICDVPGHADHGMKGTLVVK